MSKAIMQEPDDYESSGSWADSLIKYVVDILKENADEDDFTDDEQFMRNVAELSRQFTELYLKE